MKKIVNKILACFFIGMLMFGIYTMPAMAAGGSVSVSGGGSVTEGDTVKVTFSVSADETLYGIDIGISYNASVLEYVSGANSGGGGIARIATQANSKTASYTLTFKAIKAGSASVSVSEAIGAIPDEIQLSGGSTTVTVAAPKTASANNSLKSLQINPGTLSPAFSGATLKYSATVPNSATKITVSATPTDSTAKVTSVSGNTNLAVGANTVKVVVTAENGATATYTVVVTREAAAPAKEETEEVKEPEATEEETEEPAVTEEVLEVAFGTQLFHVYNEFSDSRIPEGFEKTTVTYSGQEIAAVKSTVGDLVLVYLVDENDENGAFYVYNPETSEFSEFVKATGTANSYYILSPGASVAIPEGYTETTVKLGEKTVKAWQTDAEEKKDFFLVYAMNAEGEKGFYMYDSAEETFQRFIVSASEEEIGRAHV